MGRAAINRYDDPGRIRMSLYAPGLALNGLETNARAFEFFPNVSGDL